MTLKQIEYFQAVLEKGNITTAADALFVSRPVISRALAELETEFGIQLFVRSKTGVELTPGGEMLSQLFNEFSACYTTTKERLHALEHGDPSPALHIGVTPTNAYRVYRLYYDSFRRQCPDIPILVDEYSANDAWELLQRGTVDLFFTPARPDRSGTGIFKSLDLYETQIVLGAALSDPIVGKPSLGISDILELPLGFLNAPMPVESILNACFQSFQKRPNVVLRTSDQMLLQQLTTRGILYTILPGDMMSLWPDVCGIPLNFFPSSTHHLVWNSALPHAKSFDLFLSFIQDMADENHAYNL